MSIRSKLSGLAAVALALIAPSPATPEVVVTIEPANGSGMEGTQALPIHIGGRVMRKSLPAAMPDGATAFVHEWPGVYFEAAFRGDRVSLKFDDSANEYRLLIDRLPPLTLAQPGTVEVDIEGLAEGFHSLRLEKVTESIDRSASFIGFFVPETARPNAPKARARQIEFIGDSGMAGYGMRSTTRECTTEEVRLLTDTQAAYPAMVARHFDADYQINAISGRGLVRNYAGATPGIPMSVVYPRALPSQQEAWHDPSWQPQVIVIGLYANDFSTPVKPGEKWTSRERLFTDFVATYETFLAQLHRRAPDAALLVIWPDFEREPDRQIAAMGEAAQRSLAAAAHAAGVRTILFPVLTDMGFENSACDYHSSAGDHRKLTEWMTSYLERHPDLWQGK